MRSNADRLHLAIISFSDRLRQKNPLIKRSVTSTPNDYYPMRVTASFLLSGDGDSIGIVATARVALNRVHAEFLVEREDGTLLFEGPSFEGPLDEKRLEQSLNSYVTEAEKFLAIHENEILSAISML